MDSFTETDILPKALKTGALIMVYVCIECGENTDSLVARTNGILQAAKCVSKKLIRINVGKSKINTLSLVRQLL
jgi:DNA-directed RNA polymerase subunit RPC12/RpoP